GVVAVAAATTGSWWSDGEPAPPEKPPGPPVPVWLRPVEPPDLPPWELEAFDSALGQTAREADAVENSLRILSGMPPGSSPWTAELHRRLEILERELSTPGP
ncbi:MAG: hypothetical protein JWO38_8267, partial [Gemmataceae bacterium]|nr:hypothetical protein [Gemmataceae bacterium]